VRSRICKGCGWPGVDFLGNAGFGPDWSRCCGGIWPGENGYVGV